MSGVPINIRDFDIDDSDAWEAIAFIYGLALFKLLLADTVGAVVVTHSGFSHFILHTGTGLASYIISILLFVITKCIEFGCGSRESLSTCVLFLIDSVSFAFSVGFSCSFAEGKGKTVFAAIIMKTIVVGCLVLYSLLRARVDVKLDKLCRFLILLHICIYVPIQIYHPFATFSISIWGLLAAISFCIHACVAGYKIYAWLWFHITFYGGSIGPIFEATKFVL